MDQLIAENQKLELKLNKLRDRNQSLRSAIRNLVTLVLKHEEALAVRNPVWIVVRADSIQIPLEVSEEFGFLDCVFLDSASAERHRQSIEDLNSEAYCVRPLWGN